MCLITRRWLRSFTCLFLVNLAVMPTNGGNDIQDAIIYPGKSKSALAIKFSVVGDFSHIGTLMKQEGFLNFGLYCVAHGAWILYRQEDFQAKGTNDILVASGEDNCFTPFLTQSAQPLGPIDKPKKDSVILFTQPYFASRGHSTDVGVAKDFFELILASVRSLILIGKTEWTLVTAKGKTFCIQSRGPKDEDHPICLLPDFSQTLMKQPGIRIISMKKGCSEGASKIPITYCSYWGGVDKMKDMEKSEKEGDADQLEHIEGCDGSGGGKSLNETLTLFKAVLKGTFDDNVILGWGGIGKQRWKFELLDLIFDIGKLALGRLLHESYVNRIRELFVYQLEKAWMNSEAGGEGGNSTGGGGNGADSDIAAGDMRLHMITEYDYRGLLYQTEDCLGAMDNLVADQSFNTWQSVVDPTEAEEIVWAGLKRKSGANIIIEMTWMITNMVGGICHRQFNYAHNYWALYIHVVNNLYLTPVVPLWYSKIPNLDIILGGDMEMQYRKIAVSTSLSLYASNSLEPFERPTKKGDKAKTSTTTEKSEGDEKEEGGEKAD